MLSMPFNLLQWVEENRSLLKPPVGNQQLFVDNEDFIVMVVGGPNCRKDFHFNEGEELFYQLEGDVVLKVMEGGKVKSIPIKEGDLFLLPPRVPHSPQRPKDSVGLVIERYRKDDERDGFMWFCESCNSKLYEEFFVLEDIVAQLPKVMDRFYSSEEKRTCKSCGSIMKKP